MEKGKLVSALVVGLILGVVVGYFFIAQPQISRGVPILLRHVPCQVLVGVLEYIKENHPDVAEYIFLEPLVYDVEIEERIGYTTCIFKIYPPPGSERNWVVTIGYPIVPLKKLTYEVHAEYDGIVWEGTVEHITGVISEIGYETTD